MKKCIGLLYGIIKYQNFFFTSKYARRRLTQNNQAKKNFKKHFKDLKPFPFLRIIIYRRA